MTHRKLAITAVVLFSATMSHAETETFKANQLLMPGQSIGETCLFRATMLPDGNFVLTKNGTPYWSTNTGGRGAYAKMQDDGNLVVYDWADQPVWTAWTQGNPGAETAMQNDANLVVYTPPDSNYNVHPLWASDTAVPWPYGTSPAQCSANRTQTWPGWNARGGDYREQDAPRASWCAYFCSQDSACQFYTWVPPGVQSANGQCWLKNKSFTWVQDNRMTSGHVYHLGPDNASHTY